MSSANYSTRQAILDEKFSSGNTSSLDSGIVIRFYNFVSRYESQLLDVSDKKIQENTAFHYPVFIPKQTEKTDKAILLLHGLNERKWNKYLTWAEYLCKNLNRPIILFPIAFHMNRSPLSWSNPRDMDKIVSSRRERNGRDRFLSFVNAALSERISEQPYRFYSSGRQSLSDINNLVKMVKEGKHPLFEKNTSVNIFAYSIGAFLSQIVMMNNEENLFSDTKLFMFCGGSIFNYMFGKSKSILDESAFEKLHNYYLHDFVPEVEQKETLDKALFCFESMIAPEWNKREREGFFSNLGERLSGISLFKDKVIPYNGITQALGEQCTESHIHLMDFDFEYSHEVPFPITGKVDRNRVNVSFERIFSETAAFLA